MEALLALTKAAERAVCQKELLILFTCRASQINGCSVCVDMEFRFKESGETAERLFAWKDALYFTDAERAAIALTEAVIWLNDRSESSGR